MNKFKLSLLAIGMVLAFGGCDAVDEFIEETIDGTSFSMGEGVVYNADGSVWGKTTNVLSGDTQGYDLWDDAQTQKIGKITTDHMVLDANGDMVGECFENESESAGFSGDSFTEDGFLQGSCALRN